MPKIKIPKRIRSFMLDLDGTLLGGSRMLPGALDFLAHLQQKGLERLFVTNNSSRSLASWAREFRKLQITCHPGEIVTSGLATAHYLREHGHTRGVLLLATESLKAEFRRHGIKLTKPGETAQCVVLAFDKSMSYQKMTRACHALFTGVPFIATHPDAACPTASFPLPDCGSMIAFLSAATGRTPVIIGKPFQPMAQHALQRLGKKPSQIAMVGDRLDTDIAFGKRAGCFTIWVNPLSKERPVATFKPDLEVAAIGDLVGMIP